MSVPNGRRKMVIESYLRGIGRRQISDLFNIKYTTICYIIDFYRKENSYQQKSKGGVKKKKLNQQQIDQIQSWIDDDCGITLKEIRNRILTTFDIDVSESTINNYISSFYYTLKRATLIPIRRNDKSTINERFPYTREFIQIISQIDEDHLIFIDEIGFNISMRSKRGRSLSRIPATHTVASIRTHNISTCAAMCKSGLLKYTTQTEAFKTISFSNFIDKLLLVVQAKNIPKAVFIMDNVPFHKHSSIKEKFINSPHILLYLPPYSPFLNPIKNLFAKWKTIIRQRRPSNEEDLQRLIETGSNLITSEDCYGFFRNIFSFISMCLNKEPIIDGN